MTITKFIAENQENFLNELFEFIKIPSISTNINFQKEIYSAASWVEKKLASIGLENVEQVKTSEGNPVVFGQKIIDDSLPTLLIYGHYDVQPVGDLEEWKSAPYFPEIRDGAIFGRGTTDNKAQFMTNIFALEYYLKHIDEKKWNIKVAIEGEEESGGAAIAAMVNDSTFARYFESDYVYISDGPWLKSDTPSVEFALRGIAYYDLELRTAKNEIHSGLYGNVVLNAANLAGYVIYKLKDILANKLRIPNIHKAVRKITDEEITEINKVSNSWDEILSDSEAFVATRVSKHGKKLSPAILTGMYPSLDVHGISSGVTEPGESKTSIPATSFIKFSIRLVPRMTPKAVTKLLNKYLQKILPKGVEYKLNFLKGSMPAFIDPRDPQLVKLQNAYKIGFGKPAALVPCGGSLGLIVHLQEKFGIKPLLASYGLPDDRLHGPNEKFNLSQIEGGFKTFISFLEAE